MRDYWRSAARTIGKTCRWDHAGQPFFAGAVEPCINGRTVGLGAYFGVDVEDLVTRLLGEQLTDGGWNCEAENDSVRSSFDTTICVLEGLLQHEQATGGTAGAKAARRHAEDFRAAADVPDPRFGKHRPPAIQATARRPVAVGEHAPRRGPLCDHQQRRRTQPLEHAASPAGAGLARPPAPRPLNSATPTEPTNLPALAEPARVLRHRDDHPDPDACRGLYFAIVRATTPR